MSESEIFKSGKNNGSAASYDGAGDSIANGSSLTTISFTHIPTSTDSVSNKVSFKAFITKFEDTHTPAFNFDATAYKMNPMVFYSHTHRVINFSFDIPAYSHFEAGLNMQKISLLIKMLYPRFEGVAQGNAEGLLNVSANFKPLVRVKFANLIWGFKKDSLKGALSGFTMTPDINAGFFEDKGESSSRDNDFFGDSKSRLLPKLVRIASSMTVIHEKIPGWIGAGNDAKFTGDEDLGKGYPYNIPAINNSDSIASGVSPNAPDSPRKRLGGSSTSDLSMRDNEYDLKRGYAYSEESNPNLSYSGDSDGADSRSFSLNNEINSMVLGGIRNKILGD